MLVATQLLKLDSTWYREDESLPTMPKAKQQELIDAGLARIQVSAAQAEKVAEITAKLAALQESVAADEARLKEIDAEIKAAKPVASELTERRAVAKKDASEANTAAVAQAEEAVKVVDTLEAEKKELTARLKANQATLKALE